MKLHILMPDGTQRTFEPAGGVVVAVELTGEDRENIENMSPDASFYVAFEDGDGVLRSRVQAWLEAVKP